MNKMQEPIQESPEPFEWETGISDLLSNLSSAQDELLQLLTRKREMLTKSDTEGLAVIQQDEEELIERLQSCQQQRSKLLQFAESEGLPSDSIHSLASALPADSAGTFQPKISEAEDRFRLLRHQSLTNWVLVQRTLIHLSQMIEIIATGGRSQPTYGKDHKPTSSGSLVDQAV
jgi:hypothetical protein